MTVENLDKNFISAVVYMNTADSVEGFKEFLEKLNNKFSELFAKYEIILVDDKASDEYNEAAKTYCSSCNGDVFRILHLSTHTGMEMSMNAGRDLAIGDFVFEFDECDYNFPDDQIKKVYDQCLKDYDIVCCADEKKNSGKANLFYRIFNKYSDVEYKLESDNFRVLSRRGINRIQSLNRTIPYRKAMYASCGLKMITLSYSPVRPSDYSHNKEENRERRNLAVDSLLLFTNVGYNVTLLLSFIMGGVMVFSALYALIMYVSKVAIEGWTTTILFLSFAFFGLFAILTVVIKYLSLLLKLNFKNNKYLFESIEKF